MNKEKMGMFIRKLRKEKKISAEELSKSFEKEHLIVSPVAISSWENGKSIPNIDNLVFLSEFFNVTVDDILEGCMAEEKKNLSDIYYITKEDASLISKDVNAFEYYQSQYLRIQTRHKELLYKYFANTADFQEKAELRFLINHFYSYPDDNSQSELFLTLRDIKKEKQKNKAQKYWEFRMQELYPNQTGYIGLYDEDNQLNDLFIKRVEAFDDWELDIALMDFVNHHQDAPSPWWIKNYEKTKKKTCNPEEIEKNSIRFLIKHGAKLNKVIGCYYETIMESTKTYMETVEEMITEWIQPLEILVSDEKKIIYNIPNSPRNRLFENHPMDIVKPMENWKYSKDEIFDLVYNNPTVPDEVILRINSINPFSHETEIRYIKSDFKIAYNYLIVAWKQYYQDEHIQYHLDMKFLDEHKDLDGISNQNLSKVHKERKGNAESFHKIFQGMTYREYLNSRDIKKTKELLRDLEYLGINQILEKYFIRG